MKEEIIYWSTEEYNPILNIDLAGISYCDGTYEIKRKQSEAYVLEYVIKGTGTILYNDIPLTASKGDFYLLKQGDNHHYYSSKEDPWVKIWMNIHGSLIDQLLKVYPLDKIVFPGNPSLYELFKDFHSVLKSEKRTSGIPQTCTNLLHEILSNVYFNQQPSHSQISQEALRIKTYLEDHLFEAVTLSELSLVIYKSEAQIIRIFKKAYGITPYAYLLNRKLQYAKTLLVNTNVPIKEIASRLCFADEHYFSNFFKQSEEVSPSGYRSKHQT